jgi:hypothetical protein
MAKDFQPERHRARTDRDLLIGGFGLLLVLAAVFTALFVGGEATFVAIGIVVGAAVLVVLIYLLLTGLERLAQ